MDLSHLPCSCFHGPAGMPFPGQAALQEHKGLPAGPPEVSTEPRLCPPCFSPALPLPHPDMPPPSPSFAGTKQLLGLEGDKAAEHPSPQEAAGRRMGQSTQ